MKRTLTKTMIHFLDIHTGEDLIASAALFRESFNLSIEDACYYIEKWQKTLPKSINSTKFKKVESVDFK